MSDRNKELRDPAVDPPSNDGGTTTTVKTAASLDTTVADVTTRNPVPVDPPNNDGGTT